jgi:RHS repeat-associated protein
MITKKIGDTISVVARYKYKPYGEMLLDKSSGDINASKYKYTAQESDDSMGLYYYNARFYDPSIGRFITADSVVPDATNTQSFNRYMYAYGNPVRYNDPTGHSGESTAGSAEGLTALYGSTGTLAGAVIAAMTMANAARDAYGHANKAKTFEQARNSMVLNGGFDPDVAGEGYKYANRNDRDAREEAHMYLALHGIEKLTDTDLDRLLKLVHEKVLERLGLDSSYQFSPKDIFRIYDILRESRLVGHELFRGEKNSFFRHFTINFYLTVALGSNITRAAGIINEALGLIMHDIPNLSSRINGTTPWAFQFNDFVANEFGINTGIDYLNGNE